MKLTITCLETKSITSVWETAHPSLLTTNATGISPASSSRALKNRITIKWMTARSLIMLKVVERNDIMQLLKDQHGKFGDKEPTWSTFTDIVSKYLPQILSKDR